MAIPTLSYFYTTNSIMLKYSLRSVTTINSVSCSSTKCSVFLRTYNLCTEACIIKQVAPYKGPTRCVGEARTFKLAPTPPFYGRTGTRRAHNVLRKSWCCFSSGRRRGPFACLASIASDYVLNHGWREKRVPYIHQVSS